MDGNPIRAMYDDVTARFGSRVVVKMTAGSESRRGSWFLDVLRVGLSPVVVEWTMDGEFFVCTPPLGPGDMPREIYTRSCGEWVHRRVVELVESGGNVTENVVRTVAADIPPTSPEVLARLKALMGDTSNRDDDLNLPHTY